MEKTTSTAPLSGWISIFISAMLFLLFLLNAVAYVTIRDYGEAAGVRRTMLRTMALLERSLASLYVIQSDLRDFLAGGDRSYQESYEQAVAHLDSAREEAARSLVVPSTKDRWDSLFGLTQEQVDFSRQVMDLYGEAGAAAARSQLASGRGESLLERARILSTEWREDLERRIFEADERLAGIGRRARLFLAFGGVLAAFLLVVGGAVLARELRIRDRIERDLARLANVIASSDDAIVSETLDGRIATWNKGAQQIYGFTAEETVGRHLLDIVPVTHQKETREIVERVGGGEHLHHFQTKRMTKDGRVIDVSLTISPLYDRYGRIVGLSTVGRDITEQKRMEEEVRQAVEVKSRFISIASHELRVPLAAIRESLALILEGVQGPVTPQQKELLGVALGNIDRLTRLSTDILKFQKIETGQFRLTRGWHSLRDILDDVNKTVRPLAQEKGLGLTVAVADDLPPVVCDRDKVTQVLLNLLNNAIKFTQTGGVAIEANKEVEAVRVSVRDTGPGIAERDKPRLFQSFQQFGQPAGKGGSGLGLFISKQIVQAHGGRIWVESEPGKGSVFHFTLPLR
ncbi:MAG: ATP-binding protein [Deltaproteobacteria bacterium]